MVTRREFHLSLAFVAVVGALVGALLSRQSAPASLGIRAAEAQMLASRPFSFAAIAKQAMPAVVNVFTTQRIRVQPFGSPFGPNDPFDQFFRQFFPEMPLEREARSLGSGFIIDRAGFILTNHHVVANADEIKVKLGDAQELRAKLVGSDPRTDVALIRVEGGANLPQAEIGDSDALAIGDWVLAIGNPFGLEETVTAGIVSAKERVIGAGPFDDFIQTDASINPGNSGGPLIDANGRIVGVNSAIFSRSGGSIGIGFAIPINLASRIANQLRTDKRVIRPWLGVSMQDVTPELARSFGLGSSEGALIADLYRGGPAHKAGMQRGDVVVAFNGKRIQSSRELSRQVADTAPGKTVQLTVVREGERRTIPVVVTEPPEDRGRTIPGS